MPIIIYQKKKKRREIQIGHRENHNQFSSKMKYKVATTSASLEQDIGNREKYKTEYKHATTSTNPLIFHRINCQKAQN